jgi:hypothetical protein
MKKHCSFFAFGSWHSVSQLPSSGFGPQLFEGLVGIASSVWRRAKSYEQRAKSE